MIEAVDIVIIGAGTAGCILTKRLSEKYPDQSILVLERGKDLSHDPNIYNVSNAYTAGYTEPYSELLPSDNPKVDITVGKMYGGGSSRNYALAVHGSPNFYKQWGQEMSIPLGTLASTVTCLENYTGRSEYCRGKNGQWNISQFPECFNLLPHFGPAVHQVIMDGPVEGISTIKKSFDILRNLGPLRAPLSFSNALAASIAKTKNVPLVEDYNGLSENCVSITPQNFFNYGTGIRSSTDVEYLNPKHFNKSRNVCLKPCSNVQRLVFKEDQIEAVEWNDEQNKKRTVRCKKLILSAGGIYSPYLLLKSGYLINSVGKNMLNHYGCTLIFAVKDDSLTFSNGPIAFVPRHAGGTHRDWQLICVSDKSVTASLIPVVDTSLTYVQLMLWLMKPVSKGRVYLSETEEIKVDLNMFSDGTLDDPDSDLSSLTDGMEWMRSLVESLSYKNKEITMVYPPSQSYSRETLSQFVKEGVSVTAHYSGTCSEAINYSDFSLKQVSNLHIVDTSVFPSLPNGNTSFPVGVLSEIAARRL
jgi:choline dehydrogenase